MSIASQLNDAAQAVGNAIQEGLSNIVDLFKGPETVEGGAGVTKASTVITTEETDTAIDSVADLGTVPDSVKEDAQALIADGKEAEAAVLLKPYTTSSEDSITRTLRALNKSLTGSYVITPENNILPDAAIIGNNNKEWSGGSTDKSVFTPITSLEELQSEMSGVDREITGLVIHYTESYDNANLTAGQIHDRAIKLGGDGIGYHYLIQRNGTLQRGRPVDQVGQHTDKNNHNARSIGVAFVGGYNSSTGSSNFQNNTGAKSLSIKQFETFDHLCRTFYNRYPGGQILGHNDIDEEEEDPGFDVVAYVYNKFGKSTKYTDTFNQQALTPGEINS